MRITTEVDDDTGTIRVVLDMPVSADVDRAADTAWEAVTQALTGAQRPPDPAEPHSPTP